MKRTFEFSPSTKECAEEFAKWADIEQASFFEHVARIFSGWGPIEKDTQAIGIGRELRKWPLALQLLKEIVADAEAADVLRTGEESKP